MIDEMQQKRPLGEQGIKVNKKEKSRERAIGFFTIFTIITLFLVLPPLLVGAISWLDRSYPNIEIDYIVVCAMFFVFAGIPFICWLIFTISEDIKFLKNQIDKRRHS